MNKREQAGSVEYFNYSLADKQGHIDWLYSVLKEKSPDIPSWTRIHFSLSDAIVETIFLKYSMGYPISELRELIVEAMEHKIEGLKLNDDDEMEKASNYIGVYEEGLWMLSLACALKVDPNLIASFKTNWDSMKGKDGLMDAIANPDNTTGKLIYPKLFDKLLKVFNSPEKDRATLVKDYLGSWYDTMKKSDWHNTHKGVKVNGAANFYGYWCFEAAAVTCVLGIDDTSYRDMPYYPNDMVRSFFNN